MKALKKIRAFIVWSSRLAVVLAGVRGLMRAVPLFVGGLLLFGLFDRWFEFTSFIRQILWLGLVALAAAGFGSGFFPLSLFSLKEKARNLANRSQKVRLREDELTIAVDLCLGGSRDGVSSELKDTYLERVSKKLSQCSLSWCFPKWKWEKMLMLFLAVLAVCGSLWALFPVQFPLSQRVLLPFKSSEIEKYVRIFPGDAIVEWGEEVQIEVSLLVTTLNRPELFVKSNEAWTRVDPNKETIQTDFYTFKGLVEPLEYRVQWKKEWSPTYTITPVEPIGVSEFKISIQSPDYIRTREIIQKSPEISGLVGSRIQLTAQTNAPVKTALLVFPKGESKPMRISGGTQISAEFYLEKEGSYGFSFIGRDGSRRAAVERYPIHVLADQPPQITLLSPEDDLIIGLSEKLPITYEARDDYGLRRVLLVWKEKGPDKKETTIKSFSPAVESTLSTYDWDLALMSFRPGQVVKYRLEAFDGNTVTGPGIAVSDWRIIELASFEAGHEAIDEALKQWRDEALDLLADINTTKSKLDKEDAKLPDFNKNVENIIKDSKAMEDLLNKIVSKMEDDPLADYGVWLEHEAMSENLKAMNQSTMKNLNASMQTKNKNAALSQLEKASAEIERMAALSEELSKVQRAQDIVEAGQSLEELGDDMIKEIEDAAQSGNKKQDKLLKRINELVSQAQKHLQEMMKSIKDFPDELPEDFVNQDAIKDLDVEQSQDLLSQINEAIKKGDLNKALEMARQFLEAAKKMKEQLDDAHGDFLESNSAEKLSDEITEKQGELDKITKEQRDLLAETQNLESKRMEAMLKKQEDLLKKLGERQRKVIEETKDLVNTKIKKGFPKNELLQQIKPMTDVANELDKKQVDQAKKWLDAILKSFSAIETRVQSSSASIKGKKEFLAIKAEEAAIREELEKPIDTPNAFSQADKDKFKELAKKQQKLAGRAGKLRSNLQELSQRTASLGVPLTQALSKAGQSMQEAGDSLGKQSSQGAQRMEEQALNHLRDAEKALGEAQQSMNEKAQEQKPGGGQGGKKQVLQRGKKPGSSGIETGKVRLPKAEDYKAPKEFREELLESLKEKYPDIYEKIIHKYYKRLSE